MVYKNLDRTLRRGIKTIVEYWENKDGNLDIEYGIAQLLEDVNYGRESMLGSVDDLSTKLFRRFGYNFGRAKIIQNKLNCLYFSDKLNYEYTVKLLREFDSISCCIADLDIYPLVLVETIYSITKLEGHEYMTQNLQQDIWYILSFYRGCPLSYVYREVLKNMDYSCELNGFLSPDEHERIAEKVYKKNSSYSNYKIFQNDGYKYSVDGDLDPEIYGCSVKVKFNNGRTYKYNCRLDEIEEGDSVYVSGKMKNCIGTVVKRIEIWDKSDYMEEVTEIIYEE